MTGPLRVCLYPPRRLGRRALVTRMELESKLCAQWQEELPIGGRQARSQEL